MVLIVKAPGGDARDVRRYIENYAGESLTVMGVDVPGSAEILARTITMLSELRDLLSKP